MNYRPSKTTPQSFVLKAQHGALGPITFALILLCAAWELHAQSTDPQFEHLTVEQGLVSSEVYSLMQDSRGFMWFGTANGLSKYDGYSFTTYKNDPLDSATMSNLGTNSLYEDTHGDLWIAGLGLNRFDRATGRITRRLIDWGITSMCEDSSARASQDGMWFATFGHGIYHYNRKGDRFTEYRHIQSDTNSISSDSTFCAIVGVSGTLWIGTRRGLNSLDRSRKQFAHYTHGPKSDVYTVYEDPDEPSRLVWIGANDGLYLYNRSTSAFSRYRNDFADPRRPEDNDVRTFYHDRKGRLWVGTMGGVARFDRSTRRFTGYLGGQSPNTQGVWGYLNKPWTICEDRTGTMWMVSQWGPLRKYDEAKNDWTPVPIVSDHEVTFHSMCEDRSGTMWFSTVADAVLKLDRARKPFSLYTKIPGDSSSLSSATVTGICEDASRTLWVGTLRGLNKLNASTGKFAHYFHDDRDPHSLSADQIWPILEDSKGKLWIGTMGGGLDEFDRGKERFVHHRFSPGDSLSLPYDLVEALYSSRDGTLWVGTDDAKISEYIPSSKKFRRHYPGYAKTPDVAAYVFAIVEDHIGLIWAAVPPTGLNFYDRRSDMWKQYVPVKSAGKEWGGMVAPAVISLCVDRRGTVWSGTDVGLFRFDSQTERFTRFSEKDGLADNFIDAILEDGKGCLWLCTTSGLSKFDPANGSFRNYDASDGIKFGPCRLPTGYRNTRGEMFFGGSNGFVRFHPDSIKDNPYVPPIVITAFKKFDKIVPLDNTISETHSIEMSYKENVFSFEFVALNYTSPEKNQYAYKLEGFDNDWIYCGTRRYATYTNLDGGSYIFRVKGSNNDGIWNEEGTSIAVIITPPIWATWWFRAFGFVTILLSVGGSIRYVERKKLEKRIELLEQERALERERSRISQDMHDEVGSALSEITILTELVKKESDGPHNADAHIRKISDRSREVTQSINQIVWAINPKNDPLENLVAYIRHYAVQYFTASPIRCQCNFPETVPDVHLSAEARRNVFLAVKESLHNIVKHSFATEAVITLRHTGSSIEILIEDNGRGFSPGTHSSSGNGLENMTMRLAQIKGVCEVQSSPGAGTRVRIVFGGA